MILKKINHVNRLRKHQNGLTFAVLGYPRSGTTMMSEIVGMVTNYYFDRDNVYPTSSQALFHSHWNPNWFNPKHSIYIVRDPIEVALSVIDYSKIQKHNVSLDAALSTRRICKITWKDHLKAATTKKHFIVDYKKIVSGEHAQIEQLSNHLSVPHDWLVLGKSLLDARHANAPHNSDTAFLEEKGKKSEAVRHKYVTQLESCIKEEIEIYNELFSND